MKIEDARAAIEGYLQTQWGTKTEIAWDNVQFVSNNGVAHIQPLITPFASDNISVTCQRIRALLVVIVAVPVDDGQNDIDGFCNDLLMMFVNKTISGVVFKSGHYERIGVQKALYQRRVSIEFFYYQDLV